MTARAPDDDDRGEGEAGDDPAIRSMRSVWISMRDEEPPAGGLAELLAAARVKAEAMQPHEPWWRRALATLRRPPVLALATVVVLISGAIVVGTRRDKLEAVPERSTTPAAARAGDREEIDGAKTTADPPAPPAEPETIAPAGEAPQGSAAAGRPLSITAPAVRPPEPRGATRPPRRDHAAQPPASAASSEAPVAEPPAVLPSPPPPPPRPTPATEQIVIQGSPPGELAGRAGAVRLEIADDAGATAKTNPQQDAAPAPTSAGGDLPGGRTRVASLAQLAKQAEVAAARGDCAATRALAARIRKLDPEFHRQQLQRNAAIKRCVE